MTNATTTTTVRYVGEPTGEFVEGTLNRLWQTQDGSTYVTTSFAPGDDDYEDHVMAWEAKEDGYPTQTAILRIMIQGEEQFYVNGDNTDETHEAALATLGYSVERQEDAA